MSLEGETFCNYVLGAHEEYDAVVHAIQVCLWQPLGGATFNTNGISLLDIGAGSGHFLTRLVSELHIVEYVAFESDLSLAQSLSKSVTNIRKSVPDFCGEVRSEAFTSSTEVTLRANVVLLCHSLYGQADKLAIIQNAMRFVAKDGLLIVFHRWEPAGTLKNISNSLLSDGILHELRCINVKFNASHLINPNVRTAVEKYIKQKLPPIGVENQMVRRSMGLLAIEAHSCRLTMQVPRQVSWIAKTKNSQPFGVLAPKTVVGIQSCVHQTLFCGVPLSVIGGGHSGHCFRNGALALDLRPGWSTVFVDPTARLVHAGGGATLGQIAKAAQDHGLAVPLGDRPGVGMGLVLSGGLGHLARKYGLSCDNITRVVYVASDGKLSTVYSDEDLWCFRGAGSNFGVVLEVTLRAFPLAVMVTQDSFYALSIDVDCVCTNLMEYARVSSNLPIEASLDAFIYHADDETMVMATSLFNTSDTEEFRCGNLTELQQPVLSNCQMIRQGDPSVHVPTDLFDLELYMTPAFDPKRFTEMPLTKLRSFKRCILLPNFNDTSYGDIAKILACAVRDSMPNKWCYIHILHAGGASRLVNASFTAFGNRSWEYAAVITGLWPENSTEMELKAESWVEKVAGSLLVSVCDCGVYGADLGPGDNDRLLATRAFGINLQKLVDLKNLYDPLHVFRNVCPLQLAPLEGPRGVVILLCGRRFVGKDWVAAVIKKVLNTKLISGATGIAQIVSISDSIKSQYAKEVGIDFASFQDRAVKELHRKELINFYETRKASDPAFDRRCYVDLIQRGTNSGGILIVTGVRDGLDYVRELAGGRAVVAVHVQACREAKRTRGWVFDGEIDDSTSEGAAECIHESFFDHIIHNNDSSGDENSVSEFIIKFLAPTILKNCVRQLRGYPTPQAVFKDVLSITQQYFGMDLCSSLLAWGLDLEDFDAVLTAEAGGFIFASPLAVHFHKPLLLARQIGRLPGEVVSSVDYAGSNVAVLKQGQCQTRRILELNRGCIQPLQRVLIVDDCLASGRTVVALSKLVISQGGHISHIRVVMELPDLKGRATIATVTDAPIKTLFTFDGI
jgi:adenine phosphoribosyltransferase/phosphomevalonate kinase